MPDDDFATMPEAEVQRLAEALREGKSVIANCNIGFGVTISCGPDEKRATIRSNMGENPIRGSAEAVEFVKAIKLLRKRVDEWNATAGEAHHG